MRKSLRAKVDKVNHLSFADFYSFHVRQDLLVYTSPASGDGQDYVISLKNTQTTTHKHRNDLLPEEILDDELEACFQLVKTTSSADYEASTLGWRPAAKRAEMREEHMRYLLVRARDPSQKLNIPQAQYRAGLESQDVAEVDVGVNGDASRESKTNHRNHTNGTSLATDDTILGFVSFMITIEEAQPVVYLYEIHLHDRLRGQGLGRHLFSIVEHIASSTDMDKVMLTVFRRNEAARAMYKKLGYDTDGCSPQARKLRGGKVKEADYLILSKRMKSLMDEAEDNNNRRKRRRLEQQIDNEP